MRAARLHEFGQSPTVDDVDIPVRETGQSLLKVEAAALGHLDISVASGTFDIKPTLPHIGGTNAAAIVVESDSIAVGTRVLVRGGGIGLFKNGCWAEFIVVPDTALTLVDPRLSPSVAATFGLPTSTGYVAVNDVAQVKPGERVIVSGASGSVGSMAAQFALLAGASEVIGVIPRADQIGLLPTGVRPVVGRGEELAATLGQEPIANVLVDTLGGDVVSQLIPRVFPGGRAALIGYTLGGSLTLDLPNWLLSDVEILPVNMMRQNARTAELIPGIVERLVAGELTLATQEFPLKDIATALRLMQDGMLTGRAVVVP